MLVFAEKKVLMNLLRLSPGILSLCLIALCICGCSEAQGVRLAEGAGGINPPVADKLSDYLPEKYRDALALNIFSFETTSEFLVNLDTEIDLLDNDTASDSGAEEFGDVKKDEPKPPVVDSTVNDGVDKGADTEGRDGSFNNIRSEQLEEDAGTSVWFDRTEQDDLLRFYGCSAAVITVADTGSGYIRGSHKQLYSELQVEYLPDYVEDEISDLRVAASPQRDLESVGGISETPMLAQASEILIKRAEPATEKTEELLFSQKNDDPGSDGDKKNIFKLSLSEAIRLGLSENPDISSATYVTKQAEERVNASKTVYDPTLYQSLSAERHEDLDADYYYLDPNLASDTSGWSLDSGVRQHTPSGGDISLGYEYTENKTVGVAQDMYRNTGGMYVDIKQPLLRNFGDLDNKIAIKVAQHNADIAESDFVSVSMDKIFDICSAYWTMVYYYEQMAIQKRVLAMAKEVYNYELTRQTSGLSRHVHVERAYAAMQVRRSGLLRSRDNVLATLDQLLMLIGNEEMFETVDLILPTDRPRTSFAVDDVKSAERVALKLRPELKKDFSGIEIATLRKQQAHMAKLPLLDLNARYGLAQGTVGINDTLRSWRYDNTEYGADYWRIGLTFEYQFGSRRAAAQEREAMGQISERKYLLEKTRRKIRTDVRGAVRSLKMAKKNMKITFKARQAALDVLEGERIRFTLGLTTNEELLRAQEYLAERESDYFRAIIDCNINSLRLSYAKATILKDLGIDVVGSRSY